MGIIWTIIIGFIAGVAAKFLMPGDNEPSGWILATCWTSSAPSWRLIRPGARMVPPAKARV